MYRFYCPDQDLTQDTIEITRAGEVHHLTHVLRLKAGDGVRVFDGRGTEAEGPISLITKSSVTVALVSRVHQKSDRPSLILACAIPKKSKFEFIIEKAVELGANEIIPLMTQRTEIELKGDRKEKKLTRYQTVAVNAAKQCGRADVPLIHPPTPFKSALTLLNPTTIGFIGSLNPEAKPFLAALKSISQPQCLFFVGPEGDFTREEYAQAEQKGAVPITLGPTTLRVETAAISIMACANMHFSAQKQ